LVAEADPRHFHEATPAMNDPMLPLPGLSSVAGKTVVAKFDGGLLSSDGGVLALREVEKRLRVADRIAACIKDPRAPDQITHTLADIIRFRLLMIAAGYEAATTPRTCGAIPCSRWRSTVHRQTGRCVRSPPSRVWRTCRTCDRFCVWGGR
jgi:hypothetical protein